MPDGWRWERLGAVAHVTAGQSPPSAQVNKQGNGLPFFQGKAEFGAERPTARSWCGTPTKIAEANDVLISVRAPVGPTNYAPERCGIGRGLAAIRSTTLSSRYLRYWLAATGHLLREKATGTTFEAITGYVLRNHPIPVPPRGADDRIVTRIDELLAEIDDGEAALARARDDLATWRKALLKAAVTGELTADWRAANPPTETGDDLLARIITDRQTGKRSKPLRRIDANTQADDLPALPSHWVWSTVGDVGHVTGGITKNAKRDALPLRMPYLRVGNVYAGRVDLARLETIGVSEGEVERSAVKAGDLLIVEGNGSIDQIGRAAIWEGQIEPCLHQNHLIKVRIAQRPVADWVQTWLQSPWGRKELEAQASSTSGLHTLSISKVAGLRCPVPPLAELEMSISLVQRLTAEAAAGSDDMDLMKSAAATLRQSILAAAFRGDLS